jgi:hypothetical protein
MKLISLTGKASFNNPKVFEGLKTSDSAEFLQVLYIKVNKAVDP